MVLQLVPQRGGRGAAPPPQRAEGAAVQGAARRRAPARGHAHADGGAANGAGVQYVGAPVVGVEDGRGVGFDVGTRVSVVGAAVSSSRRAPSRRPLDRRAFGPLRGGAAAPTLTR